MSSRNSPELIFDLMGFGRDPASFDPRGVEAHGGASFAGTLEVLADALSLPLDAVEATGQVATARHDVDVAAGHLQAGTIGAQRMQVSGMRDGRPLVTFSANWYLTNDVEPAWDLRETGWHVLVEGDTPLDVDIRFPVPADEWAATSPGLTAHRPVNAIPYVCAAEPGIRTIVDLPQVIADLGLMPHAPTAPTVGLVVGNPKAQSRTLVLARQVAAAAADAAGLGGDTTLTVDLAELGPQLFDWSSSGVQEAVDGIRSCALVVVASPTYKASYTGLLKSFLDWFCNTEPRRRDGRSGHDRRRGPPRPGGRGAPAARARRARRHPAHPGPLRHRGRVARRGRGHRRLADRRRARCCDGPWLHQALKMTSSDPERTHVTPRPTAARSGPVRRMGRRDPHHAAAVPAPARALPLRRAGRATHAVVLEMFAHHLPLSASWLPFTDMLASDDALLPAEQRELLDPPGGLAHPLGLRVVAAQPHGGRRRPDRGADRSA